MSFTQRPDLSRSLPPTGQGQTSARFGEPTPIGAGRPPPSAVSGLAAFVAARSRPTPAAPPPAAAGSAPALGRGLFPNRDASAMRSTIATETVGVGAFIVRPNGSLVTYALGSCITVLVHDPSSGWGGLLHFLLPEGSQDPRRARETPLLFGDLGIDALLTATQKGGASIARLRCVLVGGAAVPGAPNLFNIGKRNLLAARKRLWHHKVPIAAEEVGGTISRNVRIDLATGKVTVWSAQQPERTL